MTALSMSAWVDNQECKFRLGLDVTSFDPRKVTEKQDDLVWAVSVNFEGDPCAVHARYRFHRQKYCNEAPKRISP